MYSVFLLRIHTSFKNSVYEYRKSLLITIGIIGTIVGLTTIVLISLYDDITYDPINDHSDLKGCFLSFPIWISYIVVLNDLWNQFVLLYLFISPLLKLVKNKEDTKLLFVSIKYTVLTFVSSITTIFFLFTVPIFNTSSLSGIDLVANSVCILFCNRNYKKAYHLFCNPMIKLAHLCLKLPNETHDKLVLMAKISSQSHLESPTSKSKTTENQPKEFQL